MTSRAGRNNGVYVFVPVRLARPCPRCGSPRGIRCVSQRGGQSPKPIKTTHKERRAMRSNHRGG